MGNRTTVCQKSAFDTPPFFHPNVEETVRMVQIAVALTTLNCINPSLVTDEFLATFDIEVPRYRTEDDAARHIVDPVVLIDAVGKNVLDTSWKIIGLDDIGEVAPPPCQTILHRGSHRHIKRIFNHQVAAGAKRAVTGIIRVFRTSGWRCGLAVDFPQGRTAPLSQAFKRCRKCQLRQFGTIAERISLNLLQTLR